MSHPIQHKIQDIARRAQRLLVVHGLCWCVAVISLVAFVFGWIDYSLRLQDVGVRIILSTGFCVTLLWSVRRFVVPAMGRRFSDLEVAQQVERRFPQLGDRLSSSLHFLRSGSDRDRAESSTLQQLVVSETESMTQPLDFNECLDPRATRRSLIACVPLLIALGIVCGTDLESTSLAARRLAVPWSQETWPRWNSLQFVDAPARIALGQDFSVDVIDARRRLPSSVTLHFWFEGDEEDEAELVSMRREDKQFTFTSENVSRAFQYRVTGGDDDTMPWRSLQVIEPAEITDLRVRIQSPAYSGIVPTDQPAGPIRVLEGSQVSISGRSNRPTKSVRSYVRIGDEEQITDATVSATGSSFTIASLPSDAPEKGQYWIELVEPDGVVSDGDSRASWEVVADHSPIVSVSAPATEMYFTPNAIVPIRVTATDDLAVQRLELQIGQPTIPLFVGPDSVAPRDDLPTHADAREVTRELDLSEFQFAPNDSVEFIFVATDYKNQSSDPVTRTVTIISRDDFDYRAQEQQKLLLARLIEALRLQRSTHSQVNSVLTQVDASRNITAKDISFLRAGELQQQRVARLLDNSPGGASQILETLLAALDSNQLTQLESATKMKGLAQILDRINGEQIPDLQSEFVRVTKAARSESVGVDVMSPLLGSVSKRQEAVIADLQAMVDQLSQWDDYRRFARDVANMLRDQQQMSERVDQLPTLGRALDTLTPQQRADLERTSDAQMELARRFERLQTEMNQLRDQLQKSDSAVAATLDEAGRQASAAGIAEQMRAAGGDVARNRLGNAAQTQDDIEQGLQQVLGALTGSNRPSGSDPHAPTQQQLATALSQLKTRLTGITLRQQALVAETTDWKDSRTSSLTPAQMALEQQQVRDETQVAREQMPIPKAFAFGLEAAERAMNEAAERLERSAPDESIARLQNRALSRLQQLTAALASREAGDSDKTGEGAASPGDQSATSPADRRQPSLSLEELRLLHAMQIDIYERTVALEAQRLDSAKELDVQDETRRLATEQGRLAELLIETMPTQDEGETSEQSMPRLDTDDDLDRALERAGIPGFGGDK